MIIEAIVLGASSIVVSSLWFADRVLKREHQEEDSFQEITNRIEEEIKSDLLLKPFLEVSHGVKCPICAYTTNVYDGYGLRPAKNCNGKWTDCKCKSKHLHMYCNTCKSSWLSRTAEEKE